jgi:hypothetical protein
MKVVMRQYAARMLWALRFQRSVSLTRLTVAVNRPLVSKSAS